MIAIPLLLSFSIHHFFASNHLRAGILTCVAISSLFTFYFLKKSTRYKIIGRFLQLIAGMFFIYLVNLGAMVDSSARSLFTFIYPLVTYYLMGVKEGSIWNFAVMLIAESVMSFHLLVYTSPVYNESFIVRFMVTYLVISLMAYLGESIRERYYRDLTNAHHKLMESKAFLDNILTSVLDSLIVLDSRGIIRKINQATLDLLGYQHDDLIGQSMDLVIEEKRYNSDSRPTGIQSLILKHKLKSIERTYICKTETKIPVLFSSAVMKNEDETIQWVVCAAQDITKLKQTEHRLNRRIELEQLVIEISTNLINIPFKKTDEEIQSVLSQIGLYTGVDRSYLFTFSEDLKWMSNTFEWCAKGVEPQIDNLQNIESSIFPWWMDQLKKDICIHIPRVRELQTEAKSEKEILESQNILSVVVVPMTSSGRLTGFLGFDSVKEEKTWEDDDLFLLQSVANVIANVLDRKHFEHERLELEEQLRHSKKMEAVGVLARGFAHEFNNILATMSGFTELLLEELKKGSVEREYAEDIFQSEERAIELVKQILAFSRMEKHQRSPLYLHMIVKETMKMLRSTLPTAIEIHQDIHSEGYPILANASQVHQVLINLCNNAFHAMKEDGGILTVTLEQIQVDKDQYPSEDLSEGIYQKLTVIDTGRGIPPENIERVFEPFFTTRQVGEGKGLGLAVVHGIVRNHQGVITVDSELHKGSRFQIYFPALSESHHEPES